MADSKPDKALVRSTRADAKKADAEAEAMAAIAAMSGSDLEIATRLHTIVMESAPDLEPRLWYGMPAWARDGKVLFFFQASQKFKTRYATLGFQHDAKLDAGSMWPVAFALTNLGDDEAATIAALVKKAAG